MNKLKFIKGLKKLTFAIVFAFIGPFIIQQAFQNQNHQFYLYVLILGLVISGASIALGFLGISNLVSSFLGDYKNKTDS
ncbi:MAG: DUF6095 family protein [Flavobacteriaceae bacterium]|nr:DUF6095 family protein [Flavobacteriaceae bacterium]